VTWAVASDGSILRARNASLAAGLFVFVAMDALIDQVKLACFLPLQSLPYSVWVGERLGVAWQLRPVPE
jgi:predicted 3-demethylubiquinone-9 3-methyltransferase (glyoxalase superfamily)